MQKWMRYFFIIYLLLVAKFIIFKYPYEQLPAMEQLFAGMQGWSKNVIRDGLAAANFMPLKTIRMYIKYADRLNSFENLAGNILIFVPFGILLPMMGGRKKGFADVLLGALVLVLGIELFQLFTSFGVFDVDDIILNCFGAVLGYFCYVLYRIKRNRFPVDRETEKVGDLGGKYFKEN